MTHRESFLVRIWAEDSVTPHQLRGEIQHVRTGQSRRFCDEQELVEILRTWVALASEEQPDTECPAPEGEETVSWTQ